jgi:hypothetical protein
VHPASGAYTSTTLPPFLCLQAVKAQLLDAELSGGEAGSVRDRALQDTHKATERMQRAEKETAEHRWVTSVCVCVCMCVHVCVCVCKIRNC